MTATASSASVRTSYGPAGLSRAADAAVVVDADAMRAREDRRLELPELERAAEAHDEEQRIAGVAVALVVEADAVVRVVVGMRQGSTRMKLRVVALSALGVVVSAAGFLFAFWRVQLRRRRCTSSRACTSASCARRSAACKPLWLCAFAALNVTTLVLRALPDAVAGAAARRHASRAGAPAWQSVTVGMMAQNILPARLSEAARVVALVRADDVRASTVTGALVLGRILDLVALLARHLRAVDRARPGRRRHARHARLRRRRLVGGRRDGGAARRLLSAARGDGGVGARGIASGSGTSSAASPTGCRRSARAGGSSRRRCRRWPFRSRSRPPTARRSTPSASAGCRRARRWCWWRRSCSPSPSRRRRRRSACSTRWRPGR